MKILHVLNSIEPSSGGPPMSSSNLAAAQAGHKHDVMIATASAPEQWQQVKHCFCDIDHFSKVTVCPIGSSLFKSWSAMSGLIAKSDIVHVHGIWSPLLLITALLAIRHKTKLVVAPRGMLDPWSLSQKSLKKRLALELIWKRALNRATFLHALNSDEMKLIAPLKLECPIKIFPNGVSTGQDIKPEQMPSVFRENQTLTKDPFILFMGRVHFKKGVDLLIPAFKKLLQKNLNVNLVIAGPDDGHLKEMENLAQRENVQGKIFFIGPAYGPEKRWLYKNATLFCLPSRQEGFSMSITEALSYGLPVVITDACHFPEVEYAGAGKIVPIDIDNIATALFDAMQDSKWRDGAKKAAQALVYEKYTWNVISGHVLDAYHQ